MALIIVLAFVVLLTALTVAYFSQTTADRQIAQSSFNQSNADQLASSAVGIIVGDLRQEIIAGSNAASFGPSPTASPYYLYTPISPSNMVPKRSGTPTSGAPIPNLVRRSVSNDPMPAPGLPSRASTVNSTSDPSANGRSVSLARWNKHYLVPKLNTDPGDDTTDPVTSFVAPDWVMVTAEEGAAVLSTPKTDSNGNTVTPVGRYSYAVYDEGGLLDLNVAGYPSGTSAIQSGRKGSLAFADLTALGSYGVPNSSTPFQVDRIVGWRNYATTQAANNFADTNFASNLQGSATATKFYNFVVNNPNGFLRARGDPSPSPPPWPIPAPSPLPNASPSPYPWNNRTDQIFLNRQELLAYRQITQFSSNALQYIGTFSRENNTPSFSPTSPAGSTINYTALASDATAINPNFLLRRAGTTFLRFDGTTSIPGEPLVKTRFPLSRLAWITYKGPSATLQICKDVDSTINTNCTSDSVILALVNSGVPVSTLRAGTATNIKTCFGLIWDSRTYVPASGTTPSVGQQWVYVSPTSANGGGTFDSIAAPTGSPASAIKRLDIVASENREPDFFELLRATILNGSLGQNTGGGVTGAPSPSPAPSPPIFPDVHMNNKDHHVLCIGAAIIDQTDPDSVPTRIQFKPAAALGTNWWTAYGVESLPYITQLYPIAGISPSSGTQWATYLLFQLWNPHIVAAPFPSPSPTPPQVRLRIDGSIGVFTGGNGQTYQTAVPAPTVVPATGKSMSFVVGAYEPSSSPSPTPSVTPAPAASPAVSPAPASGTATLPGFEKLPGTSIGQYVGLRLPNYSLAPAASGNNPQLTLYFGTDSAHQFNATMEYLVPGTTFWVPYNHFIGINDPSSWVFGATLPVRIATSLSGAPNSTNDQFTTTRLTQSPPYCLMKADPRATRFGIFQIDPNLTTNSRLTESLWPSGSSTVPNGYGGAILDPGGPVEHAPIRFAGLPYFPATLCINNAPSTSTRTSYADNDGIIRPADAVYPDPLILTTGSSTAYYTTPLDYHPVMLNRPFRNVAELGYAFRDLPWKSLDFFSQWSADTGLLDVFCINDGTPVYDSANPPNIVGLAVPRTIAGAVNINTSQTAVLQSVLAGTIWDELNSANSISKTGSTTTAAPIIAQNLVTATSVTPLVNRGNLVSNLSTTLLPPPTLGVSAANYRVKQQRETIVRAISTLSQTRTWNLMIDVIAQSGKYPPGTTSLANFVVEGEQRYWAHVAIDRFSGQVIDKQIEVVNE
jgi:hypothetical protein